MRVEAAFLVLARKKRKNEELFLRYGYVPGDGEAQEAIFEKELQIAQEALERKNPFRTAESLVDLWEEKP